jgi:hypothetical protein
MGPAASQAEGSGMREQISLEEYDRLEDFKPGAKADTPPLTASNGKDPGPRLKLVAFGDIKVGTEPRYLVRGIIPRIGITVAWGPPKCGKTFWVFDVVMHVALGWLYRDKPVQQGTVVYCAFEGQFGISARIEAFRQRYLAEHGEAVPLYLMSVSIDLVKDHRELIADIIAQGEAPIVVVLDTLNRSLAGSESRDEDMSAYFNAASAIRSAFDCAVLIVHHCGIDGSRPRGHTSLTGGCDAQLAIKRDAADNVTITVEEMRDGPTGEVITCKLEPITVGLDREGEPITSCVVVPAEATLTAEARGPRLTANQQSMLNILEDAGLSGLTTDEWNDKARDNGIGTSRRATLMDLRKALKDKGLVHSYADRWYPTRPS